MRLAIAFLLVLLLAPLAAADPVEVTRECGSSAVRVLVHFRSSIVVGAAANGECAFVHVHPSELP